MDFTKSGFHKDVLYTYLHFPAEVKPEYKPSVSVDQRKASGFLGALNPVSWVAGAVQGISNLFGGTRRSASDLEERLRLMEAEIQMLRNQQSSLAANAPAANAPSRPVPPPPPPVMPAPAPAAPAGVVPPPPPLIPTGMIPPPPPMLAMALKPFTQPAKVGIVCGLVF